MTKKTLTVRMSRKFHASEWLRVLRAKKEGAEVLDAETGVPITIKPDWLGPLLLAAGHVDDAEPMIRGWLAQEEWEYDLRGNDPHYLNWALAHALFAMARIHDHRGQPDEARAARLKAAQNFVLNADRSTGDELFELTDILIDDLFDLGVQPLDLMVEVGLEDEAERLASEICDGMQCVLSAEGMDDFDREEAQAHLDFVAAWRAARTA